MSAILGRIHFDDSPIDPGSFLNAFELMQNYGGDGSNVWLGGSVALGQHLLEVTPESHYEQQPYHFQESVIVADARIDNRVELCDYFEIPSTERLNTPDSHLILCAYRRWGQDCTAYLLGDFAFAIWDQRSQSLFCARDHIGARPFYYYYLPPIFIFATDVRALRAFSDVDTTLDELKVAQYLIWPETLNRETFFKAFKVLQFGRQLSLTAEKFQEDVHWQPAIVPDVCHLKVSDYVEHFQFLLQSAVASRVRTRYKVGTHLSGGLDSSGVAVLASQELRKSGQCIDMAYTWSPEVSEDYPLMVNDEREVISKICCQEGFECYFGTSTGQDLRNCLARNISVEGIPDMYDELPILSHAGGREIRVMLSGWGGDEIASFHGNGYLAYLAKTGNLFRLFKIVDERSRGKSRTKRFLKALYREVLLALLPDWNAKKTNKRYYLDRYSAFIKSDFFNSWQDKIRYQGNYFKPPSDPKIHQLALLANGHITERITTWANWSSAHGFVYVYPLTDRRIVEFSLGIPRELLYQEGQWRYLYRAALSCSLPQTIEKYDVANEKKRERNRLEFLAILNSEVKKGLLHDLSSPWVDLNLLGEAIDIDATTLNRMDQVFHYCSIQRPLRMLHLWQYYLGLNSDLSKG